MVIFPSDPAPCTAEKTSVHNFTRKSGPFCSYFIQRRAILLCPQTSCRVLQVKTRRPDAPQGSPFASQIATQTDTALSVPLTCPGIWDEENYVFRDSGRRTYYFMDKVPNKRPSQVGDSSYVDVRAEDLPMPRMRP